MPVVHFASSQVDFDSLRVLFGAAPPVIPEDGAYRLWINDVDVTPYSEWAANWTEVVGGVGTATVTVQNRAADPALDFLDRSILKMTKGTWVLWEGEIVRASLDLPAGMPFRRWVLQCTDWNTIPDLRLVNVPDGQNWLVHPGGDSDLSSDDPNGPHPDDPESNVGGTDRNTIRNWYQYKVLAPDGGAFDTDEFVDELIPDTQLNDAITGEPNFVAPQGALKGAISGLSAVASFPIYDWIDPDRKVHHQAFEGDYLSVASLAPAAITDQRAEWDGVTKIGGRALHIDADSTYAPQVAYVNGVTPFVMLAADNPSTSTLGRVLYQGTGWGHSSPSSSPHDRSQRQILIDGQSVNIDQRDHLADTYVAFGNRPRYTGGVTIGGLDDEGNAEPLGTGWRAGQVVTIFDERLPPELDGVGWPIQRISGSLRVGDATVMILALEFGDLPIGRFSERYATHAASNVAKLPGPAPKHVIYYETLNPKPNSTQTLTSQARDDGDEPVEVAGVAVTWEIVSVTDVDDNDVSGNGESVSPSDTFTNAKGQSTTTFTAGSLSGVYYQIEASTPYQPSAASSPETPPVDPPIPPVTPGPVYGSGVAGDSRANQRIGALLSARLSYRFVASTTSDANTLRVQERGGSGYSLGDGGTIRCRIQTDNAGEPSGTTLATLSWSPGNPAGAWEVWTLHTFGSPATLTEGVTYHLVFDNTAADQVNNYISLNMLFTFSGADNPGQPDLVTLYAQPTTWVEQSGFLPIFDLGYADSSHDGQGYIGTLWANYGSISGSSNMVRERFTVTGGDRTITTAHVRLKRISGTGALVVTLETAGGTLIEAVNVPATDVAVGSIPDGSPSSLAGDTWVQVPFLASHVLTNGQTYNLRVSTDGSTQYTAVPVQQGTSKGLASQMFTDGDGQRTTDGGSSWANLYLFDSVDLQFYFETDTA